MLTAVEKLEIIRQVEKSNLSNEQCEQLINWAEKTIVANDLLEMLFEGKVDIGGVENGEPLFELTHLGETDVQKNEKIEMTVEQAMDFAAELEAANYVEDDEYQDDDDDDDDDDEDECGYNHLDDSP